MRRIARQPRLASEDGGQAGIKTALRAMPVHHIGGKRTDGAVDAALRRDIARVRVSVHRQSMNAERKERHQCRKLGLGPIPARQAVADDADLMPRARPEDAPHPPHAGRGRRPARGRHAGYAGAGGRWEPWEHAAF